MGVSCEGGGRVFVKVKGSSVCEGEGSIVCVEVRCHCSKKGEKGETPFMET